MRFMLIVKADKNSEAGILPDEKLLSEMGKFNQEMMNAGILLAGEGPPELKRRPSEVLRR